jgi:acyl transferase domain-containing protein/acyl carrier protein
MARFLCEREDLADYDIAYSALFSREIHTYRLGVEPQDRQTLAEKLERFADSGRAPEVVTGKLRRQASGPAFVFSGNGSQWAGMGQKLLDEEPAFREGVEEVDRLYVARGGSSIVATLCADSTTSCLDLTEVAQPALFALQVGLTRWLERQGIRPVAVCGHSVGEVAAAWASGALTLVDAVRVIHERSSHQAMTHGQGCMAAVDLGEADARGLLASLGIPKRDVVVAAINTGRGVTLAGSEPAITQLAAALKERGITCRRLAIAYAFHSPAMEPIRDRLLGSLEGLCSTASATPFYSTVTGALDDGTQLGAEYWWHNVRRPVRFHAAIQAMLASGVNTFVEIGPRPVLTTYLNEIARATGTADAFVVPSLKVDEPGGERLRALSLQLELSGALPDPKRLFPVLGRLVELPGYPWQRERYWHPSTPEGLGLLQRRTVHPLLGYALPDLGLCWENHLDTSRLPAYADHVVAGTVVFPAAAFVEMALAAGAQRRPGASLLIEDLDILAPLLLEEEHSVTVRLSVDAEDDRFTITSRPRGSNDRWRMHVTGRLLEGSSTGAGAAHTLQLPQRLPDINATTHYERARSLGLAYGPAFQTVAAIWDGGTELIGQIVPHEPPPPPALPHVLQPACLDGAFQVLLHLAWREHAGLAGDLPTFLPVRIDRLELAVPHAVVAAARVTPGTPRHRTHRGLLADFTLHDEAGATVATVSGVRFRASSLQRPSGHAMRRIVTRAVPMPLPDSPRTMPLPTPAEAARLLAHHLHEPQRSLSRQRHAQEVEPLLDALCAAFAERALRELTAGASVKVETLVDSGKVNADAVPLLNSLIRMLEEDGTLISLNGQWCWNARAEGGLCFPEPAEIWTSLVQDYPYAASAFAHVGTAGARLTERLRKGARGEPPERRPTAGTFAWVDATTHADTIAVFVAIRQLIAGAIASQPPNARLRVLHVVHAAPPEEIGEAALCLLQHDRCELVLASATRATLDELRARYPGAARLPCQVIDVDAPSQGAASSPTSDRFDLILMTGGLAGAQDAGLRARNLRHRLLEGGQLIVLEQHSSRAGTLVYGLGQGSAHANIPQTWAALLKESGFEDVQTVEDVLESATGPYFLLARAAEASQNRAQGEPTRARTFVLAHDEAEYSMELAVELSVLLRQAGQRVIHVTAAGDYQGAGDRYGLNVTSAEHWTRLLEALHQAGITVDGWVHLAGLDLSSAAASLEIRTRLQETRAAVLLAWLKSNMGQRGSIASWVVGAQVGVELLPPAARIGNDSLRGGDRMRDAALWGLARVAMQEHTDAAVHWLDLAEPGAGVAAAVVAELLADNSEDEVILTSMGRFVPRLRVATAVSRPAESPERTDARVHLDFAVPGPFRNLTWRRDEAAEAPLAAGELEIEVRAAGLNFRDVMYAMGLLPDESVEDGFCGPALGMELAGVVRRVGPEVGHSPGDDVIAIAPASFANHVRTQSFAVARKPAGWDFEAAATVPTAFFTAYYALAELARLQPGERVLIHGAAGGVGIAAIQIARHLGAQIFATAGTDEKRDFVRLLGVEHVFDSRSLDFADEVLQTTRGAGVHVVLNSLAGEGMRRSVRLLAPFGRMIELGKRDFYENSRLGLRPLRNNVSYFGLDADQLMAHRPQAVQKVFRELMQLFQDSVLHPLPYRTFAPDNIETAFRHMQASRHIGKIVVRFPPGFAGDERTQAEHIPRATLALRADATYLVTGGLSGFGLRTAWWLIERGARHLALLSRRGGSTPEAREALVQMEARGVTARAFACDVADSNALGAVLSQIEADLPPLSGVVHAAMVIEDALIRDMTREQLHRVLAPKSVGARNLHEATRTRKLDFFLLYSSATTLFGNPGQGAYVAANMAIESLAAERHAQGLPATSVSLGPIADVGYLARNEKVRDALVGRIGGRALPAEAALQGIEEALACTTGSPSRLGLLELDWNVLSRFLPKAQAPKFSELARHDQRAGPQSAQQGDLRRTLAELPVEQLLPAVTEVVRNEVAQILRIAPERLETGASLLDVGMDSLMAIELATSIESRLAIQLSALSLTDGPTIERIAARITKQLLRPDGPAVEVSSERSALAEQAQLLAQQHAPSITQEEAARMSEEIRAAAPARLTGRSTT